MKKKMRIILLFVISSVFLIGIGYAEISGIDLVVNGEANLDKQTGVVIIDAQYVEDVGVDETKSVINSFYQTILNSHIELSDDSNSSITYKITVKNLSSEQMAFSNYYYDNNFYDNTDISFTLSGIDTNTVLHASETKDFYISFIYGDSSGEHQNKVLNSVINFIFEPAFIEPFPVVFEYNGTCVFDKNGGNITGSDCSKYHDVSCINTGVNLYSEENYLKDFEIRFEIGDYVPSEQNVQDGQPTLMNTKFENQALNYPGLVFREMTNLKSLELTSAAVPNAGKASVTRTNNTVSSVVIRRINHLLYYSFNGENFKQLQDITSFNTPFITPVTFGCSSKYDANNNMEFYRYFNGELSNFKIKLGEFYDESQYYVKFNPNGGDCNTLSFLVTKGTNIGTLPIPTKDGGIFAGWYDNPLFEGEQISSNTVPTSNMVYYAKWIEEKELTTVFELNGECHFHGEDQNMTGDGCSSFPEGKYIDTGIQLFTEENHLKDFEISFDVLEVNYENPNAGNMTLINSKLENANYKYPGFCFRKKNSYDTLEIGSRINDNVAYIDINTNNYSHISIKRTNNVLSYSLNNGNNIYIHQYNDLPTFFSTPVTIGASLTENGNPFRYYDGGIKDLVIKMEE